MLPALLPRSASRTAWMVAVMELLSADPALHFALSGAVLVGC